MPNTADFQGWRRSVDRARVNLETCADKLQKIEEESAALVETKNEMVAARAAVRAAAIQVQSTLSEHISDIVTKALAAVFPDPYEFECRFVERRGTSECDLVLKKGGKDFDPLESVGGGVADVVSFALRVAYLLLSNNSHTLILDEPAKHLSADLRPNFARMLRTLTADLGIQCLMVTHADELRDAADRLFVFESDEKGCIVNQDQR